MSEFMFGPSAEWLPSTLLEGEHVQPRLDGGYDYPKIRRFGSYALKDLIVKRVDHRQPTLFDELADDGVISPETLFEQ